MSTPFPTEEASQTDNSQPVWNPWKEPSQPSWGAGMGFNEDTAYTGPLYRLAESTGSGAAKGMAVLNGLWGKEYSLLSNVPGLHDFSQEMVKETGEAQQDFRGMVQQMTPDPATTGTAVRVLHGVGEGGYLIAVGALTGGGSLATAAAVGGTEGGSRYQELREQGVDRGTAAASGGLEGVTSGAGAIIPAAYGAGLITRLITGAASNTAFGVLNRFGDHQILEAGGYPEMAQQQKVFDGTQMLVDAALGATFGAIHHFTATRDVEKQDAALTANLALRDRQSAPGVATDPQTANAHQSALEKAQADLMSGKPVDISDSGIERGSFLSRPARDLTPENEIVLKSFKESGLLDEEANLRDLEAQFAQRTGVGEERRQDTDRRQSVAGMTPDEMRQELLTHELTGIPNRRAYEESEKLPAQTSIDVDSLKWVNDNLGHEAGDQMLKAVGASLAQHSDQAYHVSGDEFRLQARTPEEAHETMRQVDKHLSGHQMEFTMPDGSVRKLKGLGVSYGVGKDVHEADTALQAHKTARESEGLRSPRGEAPPGAIAGDRGSGREADADRPARGAVDPVQQALAERPDLKITDEHGQPTDAAAALDTAKPETDWFAATKAATDCFSRRGR